MTVVADYLLNEGRTFESAVKEVDLQGEPSPYLILEYCHSICGVFEMQTIDRASLPNCLSYQGNRLMMGKLSIKAIAEQQATPFYLYSADAIRQRVNDCQSAFTSIGVAVHFAVKSNSNLSVLRLMGSAGLGADIVSGGELTRVLEAGIDPAKVIFSGVAKTDAELRQALEAGVGQFNLESAEELFRIDRITAQLGVEVNAVLRVNPEVDAGTHDHITTGKKGK